MSLTYASGDRLVEHDDHCLCCLYICRNSLNPITNTETVNSVVGTVSVEQSHVTDSGSVRQELMDVDSYYSGSKPVHEWTPKSLLESPTSRKVQDDVISSCEVTQTGWLVVLNGVRLNFG